MKMRNRFVFAVCIIAIITVLLAACSNGGDKSDESASSKIEGSGDNEKVTLRFGWWGSEARNKATLAAIDLYMQKNPHVKIEGEYSDFEGYYQKLVTQFAGTTAPDIIQIVDRWFYDFTRQKQLIIDYNEHKDLIDLAKLDEQILSRQIYENKLLGVPAGLSGIVMMYNKQFFEKYGIPLDTEWTWENLIEIGKKVHEQDKNVHLLSTDTGELGIHFMRAYAKQLTGGQWINEDFTLGVNKEVITTILTLVKDMRDNGVMEPFEQALLYTSKSNENPKWIRGELGMQSKDISQMPKYLEENSFELGVASIPSMPGQKDTGVYIGTANLYSVNSSSANVEESVKFVNWLINDEEAIALLSDTRGLQPTAHGRDLLSKANKVNPLLSKAMDVALKNPSNIIDNGISQDQELNKILYDAIEKVGFGRATPEEAADELIKLYESKLKELKAQAK